MTFPKFTTLALFALMTTAVASAQQHFPLRSGEWTATTSATSQVTGKPITMLMCMNDETFAKALAGNPTCALKNFVLTPLGGAYSLACSGKSMQMAGDFKIVFDGMTHMTSSGSLSMTFNGKTNQMSSTSDFRWKGPVCDPNADINLRDHHVPPTQ
jgi:uncharacterized protein DUF3617